jgi:hypothetical protein
MLKIYIFTIRLYADKSVLIMHFYLDKSVLLNIIILLKVFIVTLFS